MYANDLGISRERDLDSNKGYLPCRALSQNNIKSFLETKKKGEKTARPTNKCSKLSQIEALTDEHASHTFSV